MTTSVITPQDVLDLLEDPAAVPQEVADSIRNVVNAFVAGQITDNELETYILATVTGGDARKMSIQDCALILGTVCELVHAHQNPA